MNSPKLVHLTAIGGVGMTALAGLLVESGFTVRGSDLDVYPPASDELARLGVPVARGWAAANLEPRPDLVVIGNAISRDNPEAIAARTHGIPTMSMPEAIETLILPERRALVVAGTHGMTTTATFRAHALVTAGRRPGWFIGGAPLDLPRPWSLGAGRDFVLEGDEYDSAYFDKGSKFLHYKPFGVIVNAVEFDHADIFRDLAHVEAAFARLLELPPAEGPIVVSADFPRALAVARASGRPFRTFGVAADADWRITDIGDGPGGLGFVAHGDGETVALRTPMLGTFNARNIVAALVLCRSLGVPAEAVREAAASFHGVRRRQQIIVEWPITLIDDFAHHPTAIAGTLDAVRSRFPGRRVWALFDPRSNTSRRRIFQDEIGHALARADRVVIGPVHRAEQLAADERFSPEAACAVVRARDGHCAWAESDHDALVARVTDTWSEGDVVVSLSNGAFGGILPRLAALAGR